MGSVITQCCLPPDTSEHAPASNLILDLPVMEGWKAELTWVTRHTMFIDLLFTDLLTYYSHLDFFLKRLCLNVAFLMLVYC